MKAEEFKTLQGSLIRSDSEFFDGDFLECRKCGSTWPLDDTAKAGKFTDMWVCQSCFNYMLIEWGGRKRQPWELLNVPLMGSSGTLEATDGTYKVIREEAEEITPIHLAAFLLNREAYEHDYGIGSYNLPPHKVHLVTDGKEAVGYLLWCSNRTNDMVLRQLFIREPHRRKGIGSALVEYWWNDIASEWCEEEEEDYYFIETPNDNMKRVIYELGHDGESGPAALMYSAGP